MSGKQPGALSLQLRNHTTAWAHAPRESHMGRASGGLVCIMRPKLKTEIIEITHWWCIIRIKSESWHAIIGSFYIIPSLDLNTVLGLLQLSLDDIYSADFPMTFLSSEVISTCEPAFQTICHRKSSNLLCGTKESSDKTLNDRHHLLDFMNLNDFVLINGPSHFTYSCHNGSSVIDLVWFIASKLEYVKNLTVRNDLQGSDHFPVLLQLFDDCANINDLSMSTNMPATNLKKLCWLQIAGENYC